jgi:isopentenyl-diphosphate Delta-isomerase
VEQVILVDEHDGEIGVEEKLRAHLTPQRHRAVSVFVCDADGRLLMQRRADGKYHSPGLWSNTCCGHPRPGEPPVDAASRRLREEMGVITHLHQAGVVHYDLDVGAGLFEHEITHVFVGTTDATPRPDPAEASDWKWFDGQALRDICHNAPSSLTPWFKVVLIGLIQWNAANGAALPPPITRAIRMWE